MANFSTILITHNEGSTDMTRLIQAPATNRTLEIERIQNYLGMLQNGVRLATVQVGILGVKATGTFTFSAAASANDTVLINGVTFTAVASGATGNQWNIGTTATQTATNLAAAINASVTALVQNYVTATSAAGVVTVTASDPGEMGNCMTIAKGTDVGAVDTVSGARLTGGSDGTKVSWQYGGSGY